MHGHTNNKHSTVSKFNEFKPHLKSPKNQFQLSAGLNLKKNVYKFFKFGLGLGLKTFKPSEKHSFEFIEFPNQKFEADQ